MAERPLSGEAGCRRTLARLRDAADDPDEVTRTLRTLRAACRRVVNHDGYGVSGLETNVVGWMLDAGVPGAVADDAWARKFYALWKRCRALKL